MLKTDADLKKSGRGSHQERSTKVDEVSLRAIKWYDNRGVTFLTSFASANPLHTVRRWDRSTKEYKEIKRPSVVLLYNKFMGGVDLLDSLIALYRTKIRSKKWYHRFIFHFNDLIIVQAWLLYRRDCKGIGVPTKEQMALCGFKLQIAECLSLQTAKPETRKRGRPSVETELDVKRRRGGALPLPAKAIRIDFFFFFLIDEFY